MDIDACLVMEVGLVSCTHTRETEITGDPRSQTFQSRELGLRDCHDLRNVRSIRTLELQPACLQQGVWPKALDKACVGVYICSADGLDFASGGGVSLDLQIYIPESAQGGSKQS